MVGMRGSVCRCAWRRSGATQHAQGGSDAVRKTKPYSHTHPSAPSPESGAGCTLGSTRQSRAVGGTLEVTQARALRLRRQQSCPTRGVASGAARGPPAAAAAAAHVGRPPLAPLALASQAAARQNGGRTSVYQLSLHSQVPRGAPAGPCACHGASMGRQCCCSHSRGLKACAHARPPALQMITSIIAFAVVVEFQGSTKINYIVRGWGAPWECVALPHPSRRLPPSSWPPAARRCPPAHYRWPRSSRAPGAHRYPLPWMRATAADPRPPSRIHTADVHRHHRLRAGLFLYGAVRGRRQVGE